jgi:oxygen-independent coproporphyrinogen-3 oxidase
MTGRARYANVEGLDEYGNAVGTGRLPFGSVAALTPETRFKDALIMGLRLVKGVDLAELGRRYGVDAAGFVHETVGDLLELGLLIMERDRVILTPRGRLLSNAVFSRWVE